MHQNPYQSPEIELDRPIQRFDYRQDYRWLVAPLAVMGVACGVAIARFMPSARESWLLLLLLVTPGNFVLGGCLWRMCLPRPPTCYPFIWGLCTLALAFWLPQLLAFSGSWYFFLPLWWLACAGIVIVGLIFDGPWQLKQSIGEHTK